MKQKALQRILVLLFGSAFVGSTVFMLLSRREVLQAIKNPDYAYYLGGY